MPMSVCGCDAAAHIMCVTQWDGTWPDKSGEWVSGCMPAAAYASVVADLTKTYDQHLASFPFVQSQIKKGTSPERFPCCNAGCSPAPACCHVSSVAIY